MASSSNSAENPKRGRPRKPESKSYRIELGSGELVEEVFQRWQAACRQDSNVRMLRRALDLLETAGASTTR